MAFEYDPAKSDSNLKKHGIDVGRAQVLWEDFDLMVIPARTTDEPRYLAIWIIESQHWSAIFTTREERIRLISVRRSRREEIELYES
jgi:uncharacterized DUF497 family protein